MNKLLQKKIPNPSHFSYSVLDVLVSTVLTFTCVIAFKPSFISTIPLADQFIIGVVVSSVVLVVLLLKVAFVSKLMRSGRWNLKMDLITLLIEFIVISVVLFTLSPLVINTWLKLSLVIDLNFALIMVGFVHLIGFLLYFVSISAKYLIYGPPIQNQAEVNEIAQEPSSNERESTQQIEKRVITIAGKNQGEELVIEKNDLICISNEGHYIEIYLLDKQESNGYKKIVFRNSILSVVNSLTEHKEFIHCHRSHLINLNQVEQLSGSSKKMEVCLKNLELKIPVSRTKSSLIKELIRK